MYISVMSSCEKQEEVQIKVRFKSNFTILFLSTMQCPVQNVSSHVAVAHFYHKVCEKIQEVSRAHCVFEFHDNLD